MHMYKNPKHYVTVYTATLLKNILLQKLKFKTIQYQDTTKAASFSVSRAGLRRRGPI